MQISSIQPLMIGSFAALALLCGSAISVGLAQGLSVAPMAPPPTLTNAQPATLRVEAVAKRVASPAGAPLKVDVSIKVSNLKTKATIASPRLVFNELKPAFFETNETGKYALKAIAQIDKTKKNVVLQFAHHPDGEAISLQSVTVPIQ